MDLALNNLQRLIGHKPKPNFHFLYKKRTRKGRRLTGKQLQTFFCHPYIMGGFVEPYSLRLDRTWSFADQMRKVRETKGNRTRVCEQHGYEKCAQFNKNSFISALSKKLSSSNRQVWRREREKYKNNGDKKVDGNTFGYLKEKYIYIS